MKKPSVAIVLGGGGMHDKGMMSDSEDKADSEDESSGVKADAFKAFQEALKGDDPEAGYEAFENLVALCKEG